jgi:hypothetical protein
MPPSRLTALAALVILAAIGSARADEGMWPLNAVPVDAIERAYGFRPDQAWLDHARLAALRLARGCSASFVSAHGLVQTNHHCAHRCLEQLSTAAKDLVAAGFYAKDAADEVKCPDIEANQLIAITDVTDRVAAATVGKDGPAFADALKAARAAIAKECAGGDAAIRCDVVELYHGAVYNLYRYRRFQDVRLVFAPELAIAFFGGDPDNFEFPRYDLDVAYLRVYVEGRPLDTAATYFPYAAADARPGDLTVILGHPAATSRLDTVAELDFQRDVSLPRTLFYLSELRGILTEFSTKGEEQARIAGDLLFGVENSLKARKGQFAALVDPAIIAARAAAERDLRAAVEADPELRARAGGAWEAIRAAREAYRGMRDRYVFLEGGQGFRSQLFGFAKTLVRQAAEAAKPNEERLPEYTDANFPSLRQSLDSTAPVYPELETLTLTFSLTKLREALGPDDAFVRQALGAASPAQRAAVLVEGSRLADLGLRRRLLDGGAPAIAAADDPMIAFARLVDPDLRAVRKAFEDGIESRETKASAQLAQAMFRLYGTARYPDATFTLRLSYGAVRGYRAAGREIGPVTTIGGAFARATGAAPFRLPESWIAAETTLDPQQSFNLATSDDIVGGNSGSPVVNQAGEVVGLIFDGNIQSLGGDFGYDGAVNRAIAVSTGALRESLAKIYHADRIVAELGR